MNSSSTNIPKYLSRVSHRCFAIFLTLGLFASGCNARRPEIDPTIATKASLAGMGGVRMWGDAGPEEILAFVQGRAITVGKTCPAGPAKMLALSGGGENGAYGAGYLVGWTARGDRPKFDVVTGVSTGAVIAPLAFLGPEHDDALTAAYAAGAPSDIYEDKPFVLAVFSSSLLGSGPLKARIEKVIDGKMIDAIAVEHRNGRRLFITTTNLDAQRPVIWNIGAIALNPDRQRAERLIEEVILASASIPGVFPPVMIEAVSPAGEPIREMHVDGGATGNILAAPMSFVDLRQTVDCRHRLSLFAVVNGRLQPEFATADEDAFDIAERSLSTVLKSFTAHSLATARALDKRGLIDLKVTSIDAAFTEPSPKEPFDTDYMRRLFDYGLSKGRAKGGRGD